MKTTVSIVTGSAQGIGKAISLALSEESTNLVLVDIDDKKLESVGKQVKKRKSELLLLNADISKVKDIEKIVKKTISKFKKIDVLVNNAGICSRRPLSKVSESEWDKCELCLPRSNQDKNNSKRSNRTHFPHMGKCSFSNYLTM